MVELDDELEQIRASQRGDHEAFAALVQRYQKMIHALTFRMTGSLADAEDLAQETFIHAFQNLHRFRGEARLSSWLYRIAMNLCLNWQKRAVRRERLQQTWWNERQAASSEADRLSERVQEARLKIDPKQRAAIVLTVFNNLSHAEAARVLGCSETTVSWRLFVARAKLKRLLQPERESL